MTCAASCTAAVDLRASLGDQTAGAMNIDVTTAACAGFYSTSVAATDDGAAVQGHDSTVADKNVTAVGTSITSGDGAGVNIQSRCSALYTDVTAALIVR